MSQQYSILSTITENAKSLENEAIGENKEDVIDSKERLISYFFDAMLPYATESWEREDTCFYNESFDSYHTSFGKKDEDASTLNSNSKTDDNSYGTTENGNKEETIHISAVFKNGNKYRGQSLNNLPHNKGVYYWEDGSSFQGTFNKGLMVHGVIKYNDTSTYRGEFRNNLLNGIGSFHAAATTMLYHGHWQHGMKNGKGWLQYEPGNYYDGEWSKDRKHGRGFRKYSNGTTYSGNWILGYPGGKGMMYFSNNDFYMGEWDSGKFHGSGDYTWNASMTKGLSLPLDNHYQGEWKNGMRHGYGVLHFGLYGSKLAGVFKNNLKNGGGIVVCGNGSIIEQNNLFENDSVVHLYRNMGSIKSNEGYRQYAKTGKPLKTKSLLKFNDCFKKMRSSESKKTIYTLEDDEMLQTFPEIIPKCNPIRIPIHGTAGYIDLNNHIMKLVKAHIHFANEKGLVDQKEIDTTYEESKLRNIILLNYTLLEGVYKKYSSLNTQNVKIHPVMSRLFMWQMYRDFQISSFGLSLIEVDDLLSNEDNSGLETNYYPYEKIYFWQFIQSLILVSFVRYISLEYIEQKFIYGILASMLKDFIRDYVIPNYGKEDGKCLFNYRDLLPIDAVYMLYTKFGEPHTARTFLRTCCVKRGDAIPCYKKLSQPNVNVRCGSNIVCTSTNYVYFPGEKFERPLCDCPFDRDEYFADPLVFRKLGAAKILECLHAVCPLIKKDNLIINVDYKLTFLEFYETLLLLAQELYKLYKEENEKMLLESKSPSHDYRKSNGSVKKRLSKLKK